MLPVTTTASAEIPSRRRFSAAHSVGAKWISETAAAIRLFPSSGNGEWICCVRSPASTWPRRTPSWNAARLADIEVVVSPWTRTHSGRSCWITSSTPFITERVIPVSDCPWTMMSRS